MLSFRRFAPPPSEESYAASHNNPLLIMGDGCSNNNSSSSQHYHNRSQHIFRMPSAATVVILPEPHDALVVDHQHEGGGHDQEEEFMKKPKFYRVTLWKPVVTLLAVLIMVRLAPPSAPLPRAVRHRRTNRSIRKKTHPLSGLLRDENHATVVVVVDARPQQQQQQDGTILGASDGAATAWSVLGLVLPGLDPSLVCTAIPSVQTKRLNAAKTKRAASMGHFRSKRVHSLRTLRAGASKPQSSSARFAHCPPTTRYWVDFQTTTAMLQPENIRQWYPVDSSLRVILLVPDNTWDGDREGRSSTRLKQTEHYPAQSHAKNNQFMERWFRTMPRSQLMVVTASQVQQQSSTLVARAANFL